MSINCECIMVGTLLANIFYSMEKKYLYQKPYVLEDLRVQFGTYDKIIIISNKINNMYRYIVY